MKQKVRFFLRTVAGSSSLGFYLLYCVKEHRHRLVRRDFQLCIEGYPRSANSYFFNRFRAAYPEVEKIAHHVHVPQQAIFSAKWSIPVIVLVRNPLSAVSSLYVGREGKISMGMLLWNYVEFYRVLSAYADQFVICGFQTATERPSLAVEALNFQFGLGLNPEAINLVQTEAVFDKLRKHNSSHRQAQNLLAVPDSRRADENATARIQCQQHPLFAKANDAYESISRSAI